MYSRIYDSSVSSWRFQPTWKISVKMGIFPQVGVKIKLFETAIQVYLYIFGPDLMHVHVVYPWNSKIMKSRPRRREKLVSHHQPPHHSNSLNIRISSVGSQIPKLTTTISIPLYPFIIISILAFSQYNVPSIPLKTTDHFEQLGNEQKATLTFHWILFV